MSAERMAAERPRPGAAGSRAGSGALLAKRIAIGAAAALLGAAMIEQAVRVRFFGARAFSYRLMRSEYGAMILRRSASPDVVKELKPGLDEPFKTVRFTTNAFGMSDVERSLRKPRGSFRIAVLGDSFTMPWGIERDEAYPARIERALREEGRAVEMLNFGVGGYSLRQYAATLESKVLAFDPDLVLIGWCGINDHIPEPESYYTEPFDDQVRWRDGFYHSYAWDLAKLDLGLDGWTEQTRYTPEQTLYIERMFARLRAAAGRRPIVVAQLGMTDTKGPELAALASRFGFAFVDTAPAFAALPPASYIRSRLDPHPNARAHEIYARVILDFLRRRIPALRVRAAFHNIAPSATEPTPS